MCEEFSPSISVARLLVRSGFGDAVGCVEDAAIDDIQDLTSLGGCLICNYVTVCCGRVRLKFLVRVWLDMWKSLERECAMIFYVTFMCCEYKDVLLLTRVQLILKDTSSCDYAFTG